MGAPKFHYPHRYPDALGPLRLRLTDEQHVNVPDGIWMPYGRELLREGAHLVDEFPQARGRIDRLAYAPGDWDVTATEIFTRHGRVKAGFLSASQGRGVALLRLHTSEILRIRVAWPEPAGAQPGDAAVARGGVAQDARGSVEADRSR